MNYQLLIDDEPHARIKQNLFPNSNKHDLEDRINAFSKNYNKTWGKPLRSSIPLS
ncbi:MAG: hypothetical protein WCR02_08865 [Sphaerochaetaceae bacterium]